MSLKVIVERAAARHTASVIFIHGLGDSGAGWQPIVREMFTAGLPHVKWILPSARPQRVTANYGMVCPSWFDIPSFDGEMSHEEDEKGILESKSEIDKLIEAEIASGIPPERIVVGGFSQGGAITLAAGITSKYRLAGLVVLSSWIPIREKLKSLKTAQATSIPIFMAHGTSDPLLKFSLGKNSSEMLIKEFGWTEEEPSIQKPAGLLFTPYNGMMHSACPRELQDLEVWLQKVIPQ